jgi:hypothetical protein
VEERRDRQRAANLQLNRTDVRLLPGAGSDSQATAIGAVADTEGDSAAGHASNSSQAAATVVSAIPNPLTPQRIEQLRRRIAEHSQTAYTDRCAAPGCHDRWPCWYRRDAQSQLRHAGTTRTPTAGIR